MSAPLVSMATSCQRPVRDGRNVWWISSSAAVISVNRTAITAQSNCQASRKNVPQVRCSSQSLVVRAPNSDLGRDIRWGRNEECYGEDAYLNGTLTAAFVRGLQGNDRKYWQSAALLKHFLANSNEKGRMGSSSN